MSATTLLALREAAKKRYELLRKQIDPFQPFPYNTAEKAILLRIEILKDFESVLSFALDSILATQECKSSEPVQLIQILKHFNPDKPTDWDGSFSRSNWEDKK